ncbi:hypothetical protein AB0M68_21205 [Streptomyces sp. NPDC051453]|uniref:hypothetical protein n=1 Tax=Streptomyces sp. NPDC051453 TaxID=3154941 RepID=UPI00341E1940
MGGQPGTAGVAGAAVDRPRNGHEVAGNGAGRRAGISHAGGALVAEDERRLHDNVPGDLTARIDQRLGVPVSVPDLGELREAG